MTPEEDKKRVDVVLLVAAFAVLLLIIGATAGLILEGLGGLYQGHAQYQKNAQSQREAASQEIAKTCFTGDFSNFSKCLSEKIEAYYSQQVTNQDLKAQQDMAYWAMLLFILGVGQAVIAAIGIYFIWNSLRLSRIATSAAVEANKNTLKAIEQEQANAQRQLRAYVVVEPTNASLLIFDQRDMTKGTVSIQVKVTNAGQTPAYRLRTITDAKIVPWPLPKDYVVESPVHDAPAAKTLAHLKPY